jgi:phosphohistidine swiveling domain-containing protein
LQQSLSLYYYQGWAKVFRHSKVLGGLRARYVNGYEYRAWQWTPTLPWPETEARQRELEQRLPRRWHEEWLPAIQRDLQTWSAVNVTDLPNDALAVFLHGILNRQLVHWEIHAYMGSVPQGAVQRLIDWYLERFAGAPESEPYKLVQGQPNTSLEANHSLWELSRAVTPEVAPALRRGQWAQLPLRLRTAFEHHCRRFGLQDPGQQSRAARLLLQYAENEVTDPLGDLEQLAAERDAFTTEVRQELSAEELAVFDALHGCALQNNPLTEDHNLWLDQLSDGATRRVTVEFARRLVEHGSLQQATDVEYLSVYELLQWGFGLANPLRPVVAARQEEYEWHRQWTPPPYLGKPPQPPTWVDRFSGPSAPLESAPGTLRGVGASAGTVRGRARVARTLQEAFAVQAGEVLVCPATDPTWTPLFGIAAGLVTETGGSLSHAAVVAREYRLPAVVGAHGATAQLRTGQLVEVDGEQGLVTLLN